MSSKRSRLLTLLVLASLASTLIWSTAWAGERKTRDAALHDGGMARTTVCNPASGEPDVGGVPAPHSSDEQSYGSPQRAVTSSQWSRLPLWIERALWWMWGAWYPGLS